MPKFNFLELSDEIREIMLDEVNRDLAGENLYYSGRFNANGKEIYLEALQNAIQSEDENALELALLSGDNFNKTELRNGKEVKVGVNAAKLIAQSEFNRFYIRAVCRKAIEAGEENVEIYRARQSSWSRPDSEAKIGSKVNAEALLKDLRDSVGSQPKILPEVNSGLSVKNI